MNKNLLNIVKQIIAGYGETVFTNPRRLKAFFADLARDEPKPLRAAFGRCIEEGAYAALKTAPDAKERTERKAVIARRVRDEHGLDPARLKGFIHNRAAGVPVELRRAFGRRVERGCYGLLKRTPDKTMRARIKPQMVRQIRGISPSPRPPSRSAPCFRFFHPV
jgi:hypothetical protein